MSSPYMGRKLWMAGAVTHASSSAPQHQLSAWSTDALADSPETPFQADLHADLGNHKMILNT